MESVEGRPAVGTTVVTRQWDSGLTVMDLMDLMGLMDLLDLLDLTDLTDLTDPMCPIGPGWCLVRHLTTCTRWVIPRGW